MPTTITVPNDWQPELRRHVRLALAEIGPLGLFTAARRDAACDKIMQRVGEVLPLGGGGPVEPTGGGGPVEQV